MEGNPKMAYSEAGIPEAHLGEIKEETEVCGSLPLAEHGIAQEIALTGVFCQAARTLFIAGVPAVSAQKFDKLVKRHLDNTIGFFEVEKITPLKKYGNQKPRVLRLVEDEA